MARKVCPSSAPWSARFRCAPDRYAIGRSSGGRRPEVIKGARLGEAGSRVAEGVFAPS